MKKILLAVAAILGFNTNAHAIDFYLGANSEAIEAYLSHRFEDSAWGWRANFYTLTDNHSDGSYGDADTLNSISGTVSYDFGDSVEFILNAGITVSDQAQQQNAFDFDTEATDTLYGSAYGATLRWRAWKETSITATWQSYSLKDEPTLTGGLTFHF